MMGPGFGRLLPTPFLAPMIFAVIGMARHRPAQGRVHPAWTWIIAFLGGALVVARFLPLSSVGDHFYAFITAGTQTECADGRALPLRILRGCDEGVRTAVTGFGAIAIRQSTSRCASLARSVCTGQGPFRCSDNSPSTGS